MRDGASYKGYIEKQNDSLIYLKGSSGVSIRIPKNQVAEIDFIKEHSEKDTVNLTHLHGGNSIGKRYYVTTSNAFLFKKHEVFIGSSYFLQANVNYAFSQNFSLGISTTVAGVPLALNAKANFEMGPRLHLGFEGVIGTLGYINPKTYGEGAVVKVTHGDEKKNFTLFAGFFDLEYYVLPRRRGGGRGRPPIITPGNYYLSYSTVFVGLGAALPISPRFNFVAEGFAFPSVAIYTGSVALRSVIRQKLSFCFGIQSVGNASVNVSKLFTFPYLGLSAGF